ncbi:MAG: amino acid permease [Candidatus Thalassarchaeum sp.]|jgi:amino acid transporter|nr:amino acid permease [Candidatus Thalassarchaeum sp.]MDP7003684.1 amino acid permease [Candidatus Thalassarchaeaceae archaeon]
MRTYGPKDLAGIVLTPIEVVSDTLERKLGLFSVVIISLSAMIGSGLFVLPSLAYAEVGGGAWLAYVLAALVVIPGALSKSELASAMPTSGGSYVFLERIFGPLVGSMTGLALWASFLLKAAFALIGFSAYLAVVQAEFGTEYTDIATALGMLAIISIINILGIKRVKVVQTPIVATSVLMLLGLSIWSIVSGEADFSRASPTLDTKDDWMAMGETAALVLVSYAGVTKVAAIGGEIKDPGKNLPEGIMTSLVIGVALYAVIVATMIAVIPEEGFVDASGHPIEDPVRAFAQEIAGNDAALLASVVAILTMTSMSLAGILAASRYLFAMARDGLLPESLEDVHGRFETPHLAIILTGITMAVALVTIDVHAVAEYASGFQIMAYVMMCLSVLVIRKALPSHAWYQPEYNAPLRPLTQFFGIASGISLLWLMGIEAGIGALTAAIVGFAIYQGYGRKHHNIEITPWETFRIMFTNPDAVEHRRRLVAFHAADLESTNHLNLREFVGAMRALGYGEQEFAERTRPLRDYFHAADEDGDGVIDIDEFLSKVDEMVRE